MFRKLLSFLGRPDLDAATQLKPVATPKTRAGSKAYPSYFASTKPDSSKTLSRTDRQLSSKDITTYRSNTDSRKVIHDFVYSSPDLSAAVWAYLRVGIPSKYSDCVLGNGQHHRRGRNGCPTTDHRPHGHDDPV